MNLRTLKEVWAAVEKAKAELAETKLENKLNRAIRAAYEDNLAMDAAIIAAAKAGVLTEPVNFNWLDLEVQ